MPEKSNLGGKSRPRMNVGGHAFAHRGNAMANELPGRISSPVRTSVIYIIMAGLWVVIPDRVVTLLFRDPEAIRWASIIKNLLFVIATASIFFWLMRLHCKAISDSRSSLRKLNRALKTLSGCHQSLVRAEDEGRLMKQICRVIVETGGYRFAWVGLAEQNEQKTVRPAAQWGHADSYLEKFKLTWADTDRGKGPTGRAIRTGVPSVVQNIVTNPECSFWRDEALSHHFASTVSLPLLDENKSFGALGIYAEEPDAFDTEELSLLKELADDLAYGLKTLRLKAQGELEEKERMLLASVGEQLEEGIAIFDAQGVVQGINLSFERISGYDRMSMIGKNVRDLGTGRKSEQIFRVSADAMTGDGSWSGRFAVGRGESGRLLQIDARVSPLRDNSGNITNYVFVSRDVSQEKRLEKQLRQAQKMEALGTLAGGIAHDFNNMLGAIISCAEFALEDVPGDSPTREDLEHVLKAGHRGKKLIKQILTFSRHSEQERHPVQIEPLVKEFLKFLRASLPANIEIRQDISTGSTMVMADPTQVHQVIMNLCTNAAHAMRDKGGVLEVSLSGMVADPSKSGFLQKDPGIGPCVRLAVSDTGHGMDQSVMERIFDPFFTTKKRGEGTGLGLSVVHGIVMNHGGEITVASEPGKGTTFEVLLPVIERSWDPSEKALAGAAVRCGTERVLFVDDEEDLVYAGEKMLKRLGYEPEVFQNSLQALEAFRASADQFDLIITDQSMPHMTGIELAREALRIRPGIPIILCTGFGPDLGEGLTRREAEQIGIRNVQMKPVGGSEMAGIIRKILDEKCS